MSVQQMIAVQQASLYVFKEKNEDYGDAWREDGLVGIITRIQDKINRCLNITKKGIVIVDSETLQDTILDLHNYSAMALMVINT